VLIVDMASERIFPSTFTQTRKRKHELPGINAPSGCDHCDPSPSFKHGLG
jgi:hypothetical protein